MKEHRYAIVADGETRMITLHPRKQTAVATKNMNTLCLLEHYDVSDRYNNTHCTCI